MRKRVKKEFEQRSTWQDRIADTITRFSGSMTFVYLHIGWFILWLIVNGLEGTKPWDPYPYNFLTLIVSLEAIFLSTFVLISQNRESERTDVRDQLDYEIDVKAQEQIERIMKSLERIERKLNTSSKKTKQK